MLKSLLKPGEVQQMENDRYARQRALRRSEQLQDTIEAASQGKLPKTEEITRQIEQVQSSEIIHDTARGMSPLGKKVMGDAEKLLETTKRVLLEYNRGDKLQNVIYYGSKSAREAAQLAREAASKKDLRETAKETQALAEAGKDEAIRLAQLIVQSSEFRQLLYDFQQIMQELLQDILFKKREDESEVTEGSRTDTEPIIKQYIHHESNLSETLSELGKQATEGSKEETFGTRLGMSEEQRKRLLKRFQSLLIMIQQNSEFQRGLDDLLSIVRRLARKGYSLQQQLIAGEEPSVNQKRSAGYLAQRNARELIENIAGRSSLDPLIEAGQLMADQAMRDNELRDYMNKLQEFYLACVYDSEFVASQDNLRDAIDGLLNSSAPFALSEKYRELFERIVTESQRLAQKLVCEPALSEWIHDFRAVVKDILLDAQGQPTFKYELLKDLAQVLATVGQRLEWVPLPRIEGYSHESKYVLDNIVLRCSNIVPRQVRVSTQTNIIIPEIRSDTSRDILRAEGDIVMRTILSFQIDGVRVDAKDIVYFFRKQAGFPRMMDVGLMDLIISGKGLSISLTLAPLDIRHSNHAFEVMHANVTVHEFKLRLHDSKHDGFYFFFRPLVQNIIRIQLEQGLTDALKTGLNGLDSQLAKIIQQSMRSTSSSTMSSASSSTWMGASEGYTWDRKR
ncbi:uncharacterized protein VTP21DRAFT_6855 [Calcarisporiella thermophila]|uniref:uncharacterized protein n=1 Tax=Calcarisporiella thermophila TaxID=911321 RepID=UPI0037448449